jgi:hypothetical protein
MSIARITELLEPKKGFTTTDQTSTDAYADVTGSKIDTLTKSKISYTCKNTHGANSIDWKVLCSNDDSTYVEAQAAATITFGNVGSYTNTLCTYRYYKVQIISTVGATAGKAQVRGYSKA